MNITNQSPKISLSDTHPEVSRSGWISSTPAPLFLHPPLEAALLSHGYGGNWVSSIVTSSATSSIAIPSPSRSAAVSALSDVVRSPLSAAVFVFSRTVWSSLSTGTTRSAAVFTFSGAVQSSLPARTTKSSWSFMPFLCSSARWHTIHPLSSVL